MAGEIIYNNFEKSLVVFMPNIISLQIMLLPILSPFSKLISIHFLTELQPFSLGDHFIILINFSLNYALILLGEK